MDLPACKTPTVTPSESTLTPQELSLFKVYSAGYFKDDKLQVVTCGSDSDSSFYKVVHSNTPTACSVPLTYAFAGLFSHTSQNVHVDCQINTNSLEAEPVPVIFN
jgi:hypothetical protein